MRRLFFKNLSLMILVALAAVGAFSQTGGGFDLSHNVIASGGGSASTGGGFSVGGTAGQASAGAVSTDASYSLRGGFWAFRSLAPTAAFVAVSGRVATADGLGIRNVLVKLTSANGAIRLTTTGSFGAFRFTDVEVGETYVLEVSSRRYAFANPTRILSVRDEITDADFIADVK